MLQAGLQLLLVQSDTVIVGRDYFKLDCSSVRFVSSDMQQDQEVDQGDHQEVETTNTICEAMVSYWGGLGSDGEWTGRHSPGSNVFRQ